MFSLRILGPAELTGDGGVAVQSVVKQPKRLALLAYLALAPTGRRSRAEVIDVFWGDHDGDKARHALSQALYYLRRSLGKNAVVVEGETLALNPRQIESDTIAFHEHLDAERLADAVELYKGDLLRGFSGAVGPAFDRWLDRARETLRRQAVDALERLSLEAEQRGDHAQAVGWAERGHALAPYNEAPVRRLLAALMSASQPVRAGEVYERFAAAIREELGAAPSPETAALLKTPAPAAGPRAVAPRPDAPDERAHTPPDAGPRARPPAPPRRFRWALAVAGALALVVGLGRWASTSSPGVAMVEGSATRIGVYPFLYRGHADLRYLGEGIPELLSITIRGLDRVSTLDPRALVRQGDQSVTTEPSVNEAAARARDLGAGHFVVGSVVEVGGQIQVSAQLHRVDGELVASVSERAASEDALFELVDDLVRQLVASEAFPGRSDLERAAAVTTGSLPALRHFLVGEGLFREGRFPEAARAFDEAVAEDSTFALALYRGAVASIWSDDADFDGARRRVAMALRHQAWASPLEGELLRALDEFLAGRLEPAERLYESVLLRQPENIEAWFQLAETRFHYGALHGRGVLESEASWEHVLSLNPDHRPALIHMAAVAAVRGDTARLAVIEERVNPVGRASVITPQIRALQVFTAGTDDEQRAFLDELTRYPSGSVASTAGYAARYLRNPQVGARIARILLDDARSQARRAEGRILLAHFELARGRPESARRELAAAADLGAEEVETSRLLLATLPPAMVILRHSSGGSVDAMPRVREDGVVGAPPTFDGSVGMALQIYARALAYHAGGGEDGALSSAARQLVGPSGAVADPSLLRALSGGLGAARHLAQGDTSAARGELDTAVRGIERWYEHLRESHLRAAARERFLLAETERTLGDPSRAEGLFAALGDNAVSELPYLVPALVRVAELREARGDLRGARSAYDQALGLWRDAEPSLGPVASELRARRDAIDSGDDAPAG